MGVVAPKVEIESDAADFAREKGLERELGTAWNLLSTCFSNATQAKVTLEGDPEEEEENESLVLALNCPLSRTDFRNACKLFYRELRSAGCTRLCDFIAIVRG